jgi:hypothetical protein
MTFSIRTQNNVTQHNDIQNNDTQHNNIQNNDNQKMLLSIMTFRIMTFRIMILSITTFRIMTLSIEAFSIMNKTRHCIMATQHNDISVMQNVTLADCTYNPFMLSVIKVNVVMLSVLAHI